MEAWLSAEDTGIFVNYGDVDKIISYDEFINNSLIEMESDIAKKHIPYIEELLLKLKEKAGEPVASLALPGCNLVNDNRDFNGGNFINALDDIVCYFMSAKDMSVDEMSWSLDYYKKCLEVNR